VAYHDLQCFKTESTAVETKFFARILAIPSLFFFKFMPTVYGTVPAADEENSKKRFFILRKINEKKIRYTDGNENINFPKLADISHDKSKTDKK
jgi:hypothetical protein